MKLLHVLVVGAAVLFAVGLAHADDITGGDSRIVIGTQPGGSPTCTDFQAAADIDGLISADCIVEGSASTSITFYAPADDVLGGSLSCNSPLTYIGWTASTSTITLGGESVDTCTLTAPKTVSLETFGYLLLTGDPIPFSYVGTSKDFNDHDCDLDDDTLGIPVGCDITFASPDGATIDNTEAFVEDASYGVSPTGLAGVVPFPEPGTLALLSLGLVPFALLRRRAWQR